MRTPLRHTAYASPRGVWLITVPTLGIVTQCDDRDDIIATAVAAALCATPDPVLVEIRIPAQAVIVDAIEYMVETAHVVHIHR
jgi:hypothetical protein